MAGKRAAKVAVSLAADLYTRLAVAGVPDDRMPSLDVAVDLVWDLAVASSRLEKSGKRAGKSARRARDGFLDAAVTSWTDVPARRFADFDVTQWHVELVPGGAAERQTEAA